MKVRIRKSYGIIYKATCVINGKCYIGQTIQEFNDRHRDHSQNAFGEKYPNNYFHNAIRKHGWDNFTWEVLKECDDLLMLNLMETFMIMVHKSHMSENGYNMTWGGDGSYGRKQTNETKEKIRLANTGNVRPEGTTEKMLTTKLKNGTLKHTKESRKAIGDANRGKVRTKEACEKYRQINLNRKHSEETKKKWSECQSGEKNGNSGTYKITFCNGKSKIIKCLKVYCEKYNLDYTKCKQAVYKNQKYAGFKIIKLIKGVN